MTLPVFVVVEDSEIVFVFSANERCPRIYGSRVNGGLVASSVRKGVGRQKGKKREGGGSSQPDEPIREGRGSLKSNLEWRRSFGQDRREALGSHKVERSEM